MQETPRDAPRPAASGRISQLDLLRGFIMVVMAIDHGYGVLYLVWVCGMVPLFFACKRYTAFKRAKPAESFWQML